MTNMTERLRINDAVKTPSGNTGPAPDLVLYS